jgi:S-DNA-T family DNA segregation ATPase FtsK/SpoIIIE
MSATSSTLVRVSHNIIAALNPDQRKAFERDALAIALLGCALFFWLALASFQPAEVWLYSSATYQGTTANLAGIFGNRLAGASIFYFGLLAWVLPLIIIQLGFFIHKAVLKVNLLSTAIGWSLLFTALMPLLVSMRPLIPIRGYSFSTGGALGDLSYQWLLSGCGSTGSQIAMWTFLISSILLITRMSAFDLWTTIKSWFVTTKNSDVSVVNEPTSIVAQQTPAYHEPSFNASIFSSSEPPITELPKTKPQNNFFTSFSGDSLSLDTPAKDEDVENPTDDFAPKLPYTPPSIDIFKRTDERILVGLSQKELEATSIVVTKTLEDFGVTGKIIGWQPGPVVTVYEFQPDAGVKQSKVLSLIDDIALSLKVDSIFIHPVSGKRALGIQVPNSRRDPVLLGDVLSSDVFTRSPSPLTFAMGKTINGSPYTADLTTMPHLLAAGATGTGKSVAINSLLCSIIMKSSPDDVRMILVDPKMLELSVYDGIPHLLMPVITEPDRASSALKWAANEMERRYKLMQHAQVRNIGGFNSFWDGASDERKSQLKGLMNDDSIQRLPYILLVIDELADLMLTAPKDVESSIQRLAQKARASGIHMVLATQRPSVDVITGVIKANLPCRLSFQVVSKHDSRTILDQIGAEKLLGKGDILLQRPGVGRLERLQGALVTDEEVLTLVATSKENFQSTYDERAMSWIDEEVTKTIGGDSDGDLGLSVDGEPKWDEAINIARTHGVVSASFLQRHLKIGYNRAARIVEAMEAQGLVAKADGAKPRKWLGSTN